MTSPRIVGIEAAIAPCLFSRQGEFETCHVQAHWLLSADRRATRRQVKDSDSSSSHFAMATAGATELARSLAAVDEQLWGAPEVNPCLCISTFNRGRDPGRWSNAWARPSVARGAKGNEGEVAEEKDEDEEEVRESEEGKGEEDGEGEDVVKDGQEEWRL